MPFTLTATDNFAVKQGTGTDVVCCITGDDRTISGSTDAYVVFTSGTITASAVSKLAPASGHDYIVSSIHLANPGATARVVTFYLSKGGTTYDATTQWGPALSLGAGESAEWSDSGGWVIYSSTGIRKQSSGTTVVRSYYAPAQSIATTRVYWTNSNIVVAAGALVAGVKLKWECYVTKTNASTAVPVLEVLFGTNGSTADTARFVTGTTVWTTAMAAQTAVVDSMILTVEMYVVGGGASGTVFGHFRIIKQAANNAGFQAVPNMTQAGLTGAIDISGVTNVGLVSTTGASAVWTLNQIITEVTYP
jgi:hypothetical protein